MSLRPTRVDHPGVRLTLWVGATNVIEIDGVMREQDSGSWFLSVIQEAHRSAVINQLTEVVVDLVQLEYANASAWKCFVVWLRTIKDDPAAKYKLRIRTSPDREWQRIGLSTLRVFGGDRLITEEMERTD